MPRPHLGQSSCPHCGSSTLEHRHSLTKGLVGALVQFAKTASTNPINLKEAGLTRNQWDNFQKLKYWGLVEQHGNGVWQITKAGQQFLLGHLRQHKSVWTYRGDPIEWQGPMVKADEVMQIAEPVYQQRGDF